MTVNVSKNYAAVTERIVSTATLRNHYAWIVIACSAFFLFYKYVLQVLPSVMTNPLMHAFHVQGAGLGNLAATYFYTYLIVQLFAGPLLDRYSLRYLTALAIAISGIGTLGFAMAHTLAEATLARSLIGVGAAFATVSYMKAAAVWFKPQQFAFVGGLLATAAMIGALVGETPLALLVSHTGWRQSLIYCGLAGLLLSILFFILVRDKNPNISVTATRTSLMSTFRELLTLLKKKNNWLLTLYCGLAFAPLAVFGGLWGNAFLSTAFHITTIKASSFTSLVFLGLAIGSPTLGFISDRLTNRFNIMLLGLLLSLISIIAVLYLPLPLVLVAIALFSFGFGTGAFMLGFTIGKEQNSLALSASVIALINTGDGILGAVTEPMTGKLLDYFWNGKIVHGVHYFSTHDYRIALSLLPLYLFAALVFLCFIKDRREKKRITC